jgi:hypothetical protein
VDIARAVAAFDQHRAREGSGPAPCEGRSGGVGLVWRTARITTTIRRSRPSWPSPTSAAGRQWRTDAADCDTSTNAGRVYCGWRDQS